MNNLKPKFTINKKATCLFIFSFFMLMYSCKNSERNNNYNLNNLETNSSTEYNNSESSNQEPTYEGQKLDDLFEVYHYIYSNGNVTKAEVNVLFVDGKKDELQITIDMPDGQGVVINLIEPVSLGIVKEMDCYLYTSTSDNNKQINVFFHNGREMMGMNLDNQDVVFMNTPNYKE